MINIYGKNCIKEAVKANNGIVKICILDSVASKEQKFIQLLQDKHIKYEILNKSKMDSTFGNSHQGFGAIRNDYKIYDEKIIDLIEGENKRILILDGINDPGNLGTMIRTADWFGINKIVCSQDCADAWQAKTIQSTMGSIFRIQIIETDLKDFL